MLWLAALSYPLSDRVWGHLVTPSELQNTQTFAKTAP